MLITWIIKVEPNNHLINIFLNDYLNMIINHLDYLK
jgi:hypothetical protein